VIAYPSIRPFRSGHVITQSRKISSNSPLAERKQIADRELFCQIFLNKTFLLPDGFFTKLGPQIRLIPVADFGVNKIEPHKCKDRVWYVLYQHYPTSAYLTILKILLSPFES
jgi:hypothetical protein